MPLGLEYESLQLRHDDSSVEAVEGDREGGHGKEEEALSERKLYHYCFYGTTKERLSLKKIFRLSTPLGAGLWREQYMDIKWK